MKRSCVPWLCAVAFGVCSTGFSVVSFGQSSEEMKRQIDELQRQLQILKERMDQMPREQPQAPHQKAAKPAAAAGQQPVERKDGAGIRFATGGGEVSVYGNLDVSLDTTTKGIGGMHTANPPTSPPGNSGWMPAISTNLSYIGVRGFQELGGSSTQFVHQLETQLDVSATSGTGLSNSNQSNQVKGGLTSRNSFIGLASPDWGAMKVGKTDAPYKNSTARMNPFAGMLGDYSVIMGNSGGDNRVEFGTRVDHSLWYESPDWHGVRVNALYSPGQNRSLDSSNLSAGASDCTGGNAPGSGGLPVACNDGAFSNLYSGSLSFESHNLYLTAAYEMHQKVNRTSDLPAFNAQDVADENAYKFGLQYMLPTHTTISYIYESMKRHVPDSLRDQDERSRSGFWLALSQEITEKDSLHLGWAHANRAHGDPGQHNPDPNAVPDANGFFPGADNRANMYTVAFKHKVDKNLSWYDDYAMTVKHRFAHYDLGAGGRAVTTDCHDASNPDASGFDPNGGAPHCWTGGRLQGISVGMKYQF